MKKLLAIILVVTMLLPIVALADLPDVTGMSDQELKDMITACSAELRNRATEDPDGILIFDHEGVKVWQTGDAYIEGSYLAIPIVIQNSLDREIGFFTDNATINGWEVFILGCRVIANAKKQGTFQFSVKDANVSSIEEINSLCFSWDLFAQDPYEHLYKEEKPEEHRFW